MPTGYTSFIENGTITNYKDFLKLCTRNFGIAIEMRDEPLSVPTPISFEPNNYYKEQYDKALANLEQAKNLTFEEVREEMIKENKEIVKNYKNYIKKENEKDKKYEKIRLDIENWIPPTLEHKSLKTFALQQINISLSNKGFISYLLEIINKELDVSDTAVEEYRQKRINLCAEDADRRFKDLQAEFKRTEEKNAWMAALLESLED